MFFLLTFIHVYASQLIDHKGAHNIYDWKSDGCAAQKVEKLRYPFVDNTLEAIELSFNQGADSVEIDLRLTADDKVILFQEESVECLTNGKGRVRENKLVDLKKLDFGYGVYLSSGVFPLRGSGVGKIVTLDEVLKKFPNRSFMLNPKDKDLEIAKAIVQVLKTDNNRDYSTFTFWGSPRVYHFIKTEIPRFGDFVSNHHQSYMCWESWKSIGFTGLWPDSCKKQSSISLNLEEWSIDWWMFPFPFLHIARSQGLKVWLFNTDDSHRIRGLLPFSAGVIASDLSSRPWDVDKD